MSVALRVHEEHTGNGKKAVEVSATNAHVVIGIESPDGFEVAALSPEAARRVGNALLAAARLVLGPNVPIRLNDAPGTSFKIKEKSDE